MNKQKTNWNCILCKYRNDREACRDALLKDDYHCKSLSNLVWKLPVIKHITRFIFNIGCSIKNKKYETDFISETESLDMKHIWGIISLDDNSSSDKTSLWTMNDFDITYLKDENKYVLGVETIYLFDNHEAEKKYIQSIFKKFTEWMHMNGYDTTKKLALYDVFSDGININSKFNSIEDAYTAFKYFVNGYLN